MASGCFRGEETRQGIISFVRLHLWCVSFDLDVLNYLDDSINVSQDEKSIKHPNQKHLRILPLNCHSCF